MAFNAGQRVSGIGTETCEQYAHGHQTWIEEKTQSTEWTDLEVGEVECEVGCTHPFQRARPAREPSLAIAFEA